MGKDSDIQGKWNWKAKKERLECLTTYPTRASQMETLKAHKTKYGKPHCVQLCGQQNISMGYKHVLCAVYFGVCCKMTKLYRKYLN
jgi:hypothetical protein